MKKFIIFLCVALLAPAAISAQNPPRYTFDGSISAGGRAVDNDTDSSKLTEYRDLRNDALLPRLSLRLFDSQTGGFFTFTGSDISLNDQSLAFRGGMFGRLKVDINWAGIPHNFSNKAQTPYFRTGAGRLEVPANIPITFKKLATAAADAPSVVANDPLIANYQASFLHGTPLSTQTNIGRVALLYTGLRQIDLGIAYNRRTKEGLKSAFGPIGDRPPRTLNIELTEPVDYLTNDLTFSAEHVGRWFDAQFDYTFSDFANRIDTLVWENVFATPSAPESTFDTWDRSVSVFGRRPLPPDNRYHNASISIGRNLPADSRLTGTFSFGQLDQNETLLPYSFNSDVLVNKTLARSTADAHFRTTQALVDYVINPTSRLNLRASVRHFGLNNNTPSANWQYVTSDTSGLTGTVSYKNKRVNLPYASDRTTGGIEGNYRIMRSTFSFGYERQAIRREFREADTSEDRLTLSWRLRPASWVNLRARYLFGDRRSGEFNPYVNRQSYWYTRTEANDQDNPQFTFTNHPDMVRFDVADRRRQQGEFTLTLNPLESVSLSGHIRYRKDDFDSNTKPSSPLADTEFGEVTSVSPGDQLGLLKDKRLRYSLDAFYMPAERFSVNAFLSVDNGASLQRSLEFNENNKGNPSTIATAELGPWTRRESQWTMDLDDDNWTFGFGGTVGIVPERVSLDASYSVSLGQVDTTYAGYGVTNFNGTPFPPNHQFAFGTPPRVNEDLHVFDLRSEIPIVGQVALVLGYSFERFRLDDWQQETAQPWVEPVGSEFLLRDTSRSHQWGNRLFNMGSLLAPRYDAHMLFGAFKYRF